LPASVLNFAALSLRSREARAFPLQAVPREDAMMPGLSVLRWSPFDFWRATPRELVAAWEGLRRDLRRLLAAFPDGEG
jgi:uncharacterized phage protein (TIGR02216 family)